MVERRLDRASFNREIAQKGLLSTALSEAPRNVEPFAPPENSIPVELKNRFAT